MIHKIDLGNEVLAIAAITNGHDKGNILFILGDIKEDVNISAIMSQAKLKELIKSLAEIENELDRADLLER
jgi:hypothetical protein